MLDLGFEREMNQCLDIIKKKCPQIFLKNSADYDKITDEEKRLKAQTFHSNQLKINFVSATMDPKVETLGKRLMKDYAKVGFGETTDDQPWESIPK